MKIIKLQTENVKRLQAVEITPGGGNMVVIGGKNGAGKSSVLDSIEFALGGDPSAKMPVRRGEDKARIVVDLGDLVIKRVFTAAGGTSLVVTDADGRKQSTPQAILDKLVGRLTFDPLAFSREKPKEQAEILRQLLGLDFTALDTQRQTAFDARTLVNRDVKALEARVTSMPKVDGVPGAEVSAADILKEQEDAIAKNNANRELRHAAATARAKLARHADEVVAIKSEIAEAMRILAALEGKLSLYEDETERLESAVKVAEAAESAAVDIDLAPFRTRVAEVESVNRKVSEAKHRSELVKSFKAKSSDAERLTATIEDCDNKKRRALLDAKFPVPGLSFDATGGVTLNEIPFDQCSSADQLRVSVAVGLALNPKLRVLLIRDGSLLDDESMASLVAMAKEANAQVWIERVGTDDHTSVVIEDGQVAVLQPLCS